MPDLNIDTILIEAASHWIAKGIANDAYVGCAAPSDPKRVMAGLERIAAERRASEKVTTGKPDLFDAVRYSRKPTPEEISFGHGCTHYKEFPLAFVIKDYRGFVDNFYTLKKRIKCPIDGLTYTRG